MTNHVGLGAAFLHERKQTMGDLLARTLDGGEVVLSEAAVSQFRSALHGNLLQRGDDQYEEVRRVYNAMIDRHPALIAQCADVEDVIATVNFARENQVLLAVRGGGHNGPGLGTCEGGLVLALSPMRGVQVDPEAQTVRVEGGCTWGDVDRATHAFGLATPSGIISTTGVGGLTLGGGHGYLTRKYGLTIDNLLAADVVLADGSFVTASADEHPDLFWALRGGGGNFGAVTSFHFRLHPVDTVFAGPILWSLDQAAEAMRRYREFIPQTPEETNAFFAFLKVPPAPPFPEELHGRTVCGVVCCHLGAPELGEMALRPLREFGPPLFVHLGTVPYPALQSMFDALYPPGLQWYWKGDFFNELSDAAITQHVQHGADLPTLFSTVHIYPIDGAPHRVGRDETAFSYREARWSEVIVGVAPDPVANPEIISWTRAYWDAVHPYSAGGAYINFMMEEGQERVQATYRDNFPRLVEVKTRYDPQNLFRVNQNIRPAVHERSSYERHAA